MPAALESLLDPIDPKEFRDRYYGKQPLVIRGRPEKFAALFTWADLNRLLNASAFPHPNIDISAPGRREPAESAASLVEQCRAGAALLVSQLHLFDPKVGELVRSLEAETGEPMAVTLILSQPGQTAFAKHYDRNDVFVLHLYGRKGWSVYDRTVEKPVVGMVESSAPRPRQPAFECELGPGDVMYLPRGHWHQALAQSGPSLHLSLVVAARTGVDFLTWLTDELRNDLRFRQELPLSFAGEAEEVRDARLRQHIAGLEDALLSRLRDEETIRSYTRHCVAADRDVRPVKFPAQLFEAPGAQLQVRQFSRPARQRFVLEEDPSGDGVVLSVWGHTFRFPKGAKPLIEFVLSRTAFSYEEAQAHAGELTEEGMAVVLNPLLRDGILEAADSG